MNEVKKVHLGRQQFTISVDAHKDLQEYLRAIEKQPGVQSEVVKEVEMRMAELLTERGVSDDKVVLKEDVDFLQQQLGEPRDFKDEDSKAEAEDAQDAKEEDRPKRLFRDTQNGVIAGVASGLAAYLGIDALLIRIGFIALTFASGVGILLYILIWLLAPEAKTPSDRLQMQGKAVTVDSLKEMVDRADIAGASQRAGRNVGRGLGRLLEAIFKVIAMIVGAAFVAAGVVVMLWSMIASVYLLIHGGQIGSDIAFPLGSREVWFVVLAAITTGLTGFFMLLLGLTMVGSKWRLPGWLLAVLIGIFFVAAGVGTALGFDTVPHIRERFQAAHHTQTREVPEFNKLSLQGEDTHFAFKSDTTYFVELSYLGNGDTKLLTAQVHDKLLTIDSSKYMREALCNGFCLYSDHDLMVTVHAPSLESVNLGGIENSFKVDDGLTQQALDIMVRRRSGNNLHLDVLHTDSVVLTDSNSKDWRLLLSGLTPGSSHQDRVSLSDNDEIMHASNTATFHLETDRTCDESSPIVYLSASTSLLQINNRTIKSAGELQDARSVDRQSAENCAVMRP